MKEMEREVIYYMEKMGCEVIYYLRKVERDIGISPFLNSGRNSVKRAKILDFAKILKF